MFSLSPGKSGRTYVCAVAAGALLILTACSSQGGAPTSPADSAAQPGVVSAPSAASQPQLNTPGSDSESSAGVDGVCDLLTETEITAAGLPYSPHPRGNASFGYDECGWFVDGMQGASLSLTTICGMDTGTPQITPPAGMQDLSEPLSGGPPDFRIIHGDENVYVSGKKNGCLLLFVISEMSDSQLLGLVNAAHARL